MGDNPPDAASAARRSKKKEISKVGERFIRLLSCACLACNDWTQIKCYDCIFNAFVGVRSLVQLYLAAFVPPGFPNRKMCKRIQI